MKCDYAKLFIHDYIDGYLADEQQNIIHQHLLDCAECKNSIYALKNQKIDLNQIATPELNLNIQTIASNIQREKKSGTRYITRFPFSAAASFLVASTLGFLLFNQSHTPTHDNIKPLMESAQISNHKKSYNLVFHSPKAIGNVVFTIILPKQTELAGYPGENKVVWVSRLNQGKNILTLPVISTNNSQDDIIITKIYYEENTKIFQIKLNSTISKQIT